MAPAGVIAHSSPHFNPSISPSTLFFIDPLLRFHVDKTTCPQGRGAPLPAKTQGRTLDCLLTSCRLVLQGGFVHCVAGTLWLNEGVLSGLVKDMLIGSTGSRAPSCRDPLAY